MAYIQLFEKLSKNDAAIAGGKGASLGEMTQAGIPVPPGFVVLSEAFEEFLKETDLGVELDAILDSVDHKQMHQINGASEKIQALILGKEMPKAITKEITVSFKKLGAKYVAVRSSATSEDSADAAWAGQLDSYLNTTQETLLQNVRKCWASLFTPRAIFYRLEKGLHSKPISVAVVVQKMIQSEVSGIAFSVHPVTQDYDQLIIEAGLGLGEAIVQGSITPDSFVVEKSKRSILDKNIATQERGMFRKDKITDEDANEWRDISSEEGEKPALSDFEVLELSDLIIKIEKHYGFPVDVEWAREKGKSYIVQSRPITTLKVPIEKEQPLKVESTPPDLLEYVRLFQFDGFVPYVLSHEFVLAYLEYGGLTYGSDKMWLSFMRKSALEETLQEGVELYKSREKYEAYKKDTHHTFKKIQKDTKAIEKSKSLTLQQVVDYLLLLKSYQILYQETEFFYTDRAFEKRNEHPTIKENFQSFEQFKIQGRSYLNQIYFVPDSLFSHFLRKLAEQFQVPETDLLHYSIHELPTLFDGVQVDPEIVRARSLGYVIWEEDKSIYALYGKEALDFINRATVHDKDQKVLTGKIANKGKVTAKAKVIKVSLADYDNLARFIDEMEEGQVLVAETTEPAIMAACKKASAIVTNQGGMMSHAAIVSREMNIPCIVGTSEATEVIEDGDLVEVDANKGVVRIVSASSSGDFGKITSDNYDFLWRIGFSYLFCSIHYQSGYAERDFVFTWKNGEHFNFVGKEERKRLAKEGLVLYTHKFKSFQSRIEKNTPKYSRKMDEFFVQDLGEMTNQELANSFSELVDLTLKVFKDYFYLEYHSTDEVARIVEQNDKSYDVGKLKEELEVIGKLKFGLRETWNKVLYSPSVLNKYAEEISRRLSLGESVYFYRFDELIEMLGGKRITIPNRSAVVWGKFSEGKDVTGKDADLIIDRLQRVDRSQKEFSGSIGNKGYYKGKVKKIEFSEKTDFKKEISFMKEGDVLVSGSTGPEMILACKKAGAIITDEGGIISHAAIVSRELGIPSVIGTKIATRLLDDGDMVEVDANKGVVRILK